MPDDTGTLGGEYVFTNVRGSCQYGFASERSSMRNGLFKYFSTDPDKLERFTNRQVYLTPPRYFNDPWDFLVRSDPHSEKEIAKSVPSVSGPERREFAEFVNGPDSLEDEAGEQQDGLSRLVGVVCLTEDPINRVMWAYYGESHRGFVAEFRCAELPGKGQKASPYSACKTPFGPAAKVSYCPTLPAMNADKTNSKEVFWTKQSAWRHEKEWRVVGSLTQGRHHPTRKDFVLVDFDPTNLLRVVFGLRISASVKERLENMLMTNELKHVSKGEVFINPATRRLKIRPAL